MNGQIHSGENLYESTICPCSVQSFCEIGLIFLKRIHNKRESKKNQLKYFAFNAKQDLL
jgi:hypothetical protein